MARLGMLKGGDVRCLSVTFMSVVLFCCLFLLALQPTHYAAKPSMLDLPKDEIVKVQSIPSLAVVTASSKNSGKSGKKKEQKNSKSDKKASKAKWFKDELPPKKAHSASHVESNATGGVPGGVKDSGNGSSYVLTPTQLVPEHQSPKPAPQTTETYTSNASHVKGTHSAASPAPPGHDHDAKQTQTVSDTLSPSQDNPEEKTRSILTASSSHDQHIKETSSVSSRKLESYPQAKVSTAESEQSRSIFPNLNNAQVSKFVSPFIESKSSERRLEKKIITWHKPRDVQELYRAKKALENCPSSWCKLAYPLPESVLADAIVFDSVAEGSFPPRRVNDQVFIFHVSEPPSVPLKGFTPAWNSAFNWTWTYRRDSDIWQPFGMLKKAKKVRPLDYFQTVAKAKSRAVVWMPVTCPTTTTTATLSQRDVFVQQLAQHVRIASLGPCFNKSCSKADPSSSTCSESLTKKFFFLLALEDDLCKDYVTEVFYRAWEEGTHIVPVVRGGADYNSFFPEGTYVDADWFDSAKQLAHFMAELMANRQTYSQLLWRKAHWVRAGRRSEDMALCKLCDMLQAAPSRRKHYPDMGRWYQANVCKTPGPF